MAECRQLICDQPAEFEVTVRYFGGVRERKALYCIEHLTRVQEAIATRETSETSEITNIRPLRGTIVTDESPSAAAENLITNLKHERARLNDENQNLERVNADLKRDVAAADAAIGRLKDSEHRLKGSLTAEQKRVEALVRLLHEIANEAEDSEQANALSENIDDRLEELGLSSRIKHYEIIVTVPAQVRIKVDARDKDAAREMFNQGKVEWRSEDYEEWLEDDTEVVEIIEVQS